MTRGRANDPILLHATPAVRCLPVGGAVDPDVRSRTTAAVARLLGDPPGLVLTTSCSAALEAAAAALDLGPGDEVVVPAFTFPTSATPYVARGVTVRFADVDPLTGNVDPAEVLARLGPRTRAVVVMHYGGVGADLALLADGLAARGIDVVEDAAQGIFGTVDGRPLGRSGRFAAVSFHHTKNLSSIDGGALVVNDAADLDRIHVAVDKGTDRVRFDQGLTPSYEWCGVGSGLRMPEASVRYLADELEGIDRVQARRHAVWDRYAAELVPWAEAAGVRLPSLPAGRGNPAHLFALVLPEADDRPRFVARCAAAGVQVARHFGSLPDSPFGRTIAHPDDACPRATDLAARLVRIPLHQDLSDEQVDRVVAAVTTAL